MDYSMLAFEVPNFIADHIKAIYLISGMTSAMIALVMFLPRANALTIGDWVKYFGLAFAFIAVQYFVHLVIKAAFPNWQEYYPYHLIWAVCSAANSILFLAAAISLLGHTNLFPRRVLIFAALAALALSFEQMALPHLWLSWVRLPDALLSAFCLGAAGVAIGSNISFHWKKGLALSAIFVALVYAGILLVYGFHPMLARSDKVNSWLGPSDEQVSQIQEDLKLKGIFKNRENIKTEQTLKNLDVLAFAISLPLKLGLFLPAYILLIFILRTSEQSDHLLERLSEERLSYLSGTGIVNLIGERLKADKVELSFLVPGRRVATFQWSYGGGYSDIAEIKQLNDDPTLAGVMNDGKFRKRLAAKSSAPERFIAEGEMEFNHLITKVNAVFVPIKYHGGVVGCLKIEQDDSKYFSETAIQQAKSFARFLTLVAQPYRYLATLDQISYRSARLQVEHKIKDSEEAATELVKIINDVLSPIASGIFLKIGFKQQKKVIGGNAYHQALINGRWDAPRDLRKSIEFMRIPFIESREALEAYEAPLDTNLFYEAQFAPESRRSKSRGASVGSFIFVARADKDEVNKPTLGTFYFHRMVISSILADAILDLAREIHNEALKQFSLAVSAEDIGVENWFAALEESAKKAELLWAISISPPTENSKEPSFLGKEEHIALVKQILQKDREKIEFQIKDEGLALIHRDELSYQAKNVIFMRLKETGRLISFGIERLNFGIELDFESPWKTFLLALRDLADSTLVRILKDDDFRRIQIEASQNQALATVAATTGTIIHQLVNMTRDQMSASATLRAALRMGKLHAESARLHRIIHNMRESGKSMLELTQSITNITKVDDTRPCNLVQAIKNARDLFGISIAQNGIKFKFEVDPNLMIDVPYYVAALALANLVSNSKDALKAGGRGEEPPDKQIQITVEETPDEEGNEWVHCHVMDTGLGISDGNREKVFHLGFSTKPNSGGWGMYLVKRALRENGSDIELTSPGPYNTTFSIRFPKAKITR